MLQLAKEITSMPHLWFVESRQGIKININMFNSM